MNTKTIRYKPDDQGAYKLRIQVETRITQEDIDDIMCSALEGGICHWCTRAVVVGKYLGEYASEQISRGGVLKLYDEEGECFELSLDKLMAGIGLAISNGYAKDWLRGCEIDCGQIDAEAADIIIQLALFQDIIYG